jgi:hypothetical protein
VDLDVLATLLADPVGHERESPAVPLPQKRMLDGTHDLDVMPGPPRRLRSAPAALREGAEG